MPPATSRRQEQLSPSQHSTSTTNGHNSGSSSKLEQQIEVQYNKGSLNRGARGSGAIRNRASESIDTSQKRPPICREQLEALKRRSLPYQPQRSSSLTSPPETPPESPPSSPTGKTHSPETDHDEAFRSHPESWGKWWRGLIPSRVPSMVPMPTPMEERSSDNGGDGISLGDGEETAPSDEGTSSNISKSPDRTALPAKNPTSSRYTTPFWRVWTLRRRPACRPVVHPIVYGLISSGGEFRELETALDRGCEVLGGPSMFGTSLAAVRRSRNRRVVEVDYNVDDERPDVPNISHESSFDHRESHSHIENAEPLRNTGGLHGIPVIEGIDPTVSDSGSAFDPVGKPPSSPRPAHRSLAFAQDTPPSAATLNDTPSRSRTQAYTDSALLISRRIRKKFGSPVSASATTGAPDIARNESTSTTDGAINAAAFTGEGDLTISDAIAGSVQVSMATTTAQPPVENLAQLQNGSSSADTTPTEPSAIDTLPPQARDASGSTPEPDHACLGNDVENFAPLERVPSHRPSIPRLTRRDSSQRSDCGGCVG